MPFSPPLVGVPRLEVISALWERPGESLPQTVPAGSRTPQVTPSPGVSGVGATGGPLPALHPPRPRRALLRSHAGSSHLPPLMLFRSAAISVLQKRAAHRDLIKEN